MSVKLQRLALAAIAGIGNVDDTFLHLDGDRLTYLEGIPSNLDTIYRPDIKIRFNQDDLIISRRTTGKNKLNRESGFNVYIRTVSVDRAEIHFMFSDPRFYSIPDILAKFFKETDVVKALTDHDLTPLILSQQTKSQDFVKILVTNDTIEFYLIVKEGNASKEQRFPLEELEMYAFTHNGLRHYYARAILALDSSIYNSSYGGYIVTHEVNQITERITTQDYLNYSRYPLPSNIRRVVLGPLPQFVAAEAFRGSQSPYSDAFLNIVQQIKNEYGDVTVDLEVVDALQATHLLTVRVMVHDILSHSLVFTVVPVGAPLYATLRIPTALVVISEVRPSTLTSAIIPAEISQFEDNVVHPNAAAAAAMIGGGLLSGVGQGLGMWAQAKTNKEMKEMDINWMREKNNQDWSQRSMLQQSMFGQESAMQGRYFQQQNLMQGAQFDQQLKLQQSNQNFTSELAAQERNQQLRLQQNQQQLARELVNLTSDADMRRASYAQSLAGYRTGGAVSGLNLAGRGGLGHPNAPAAGYQPPRTTGTQTSTPKVFSTQPTINVTGPSSSFY